MDSKKLPLVVDLDGSLVTTDMLYETFVRAVFRYPWVIFLAPVWLLRRGRAYLKFKLAEIAVVDVSVLPYHTELLDYLKQQNSRELVLCTATNQGLAEKIADHLGIFSSVMGSTERVNLAGKNKARSLEEKYSKGGFVYVGNESRDKHIWAISEHAVVVSSDQKLVNSLPDNCAVEATFTSPVFTVRKLMAACRLHQWVKNSLLFVPMLVDKEILNLELLLTGIVAFLAFGFCASSTYIVNDLADLDSDRRHWKKKSRPFASGALSILSGFKVSGAFMILAFALALSVSVHFALLLVCYVVITLAYSFTLKRRQTLDVLTLAGLYTLRIIAGGAAVGIAPSFWLLAFSMFLFFCLAIIKRLSELTKISAESNRYTKLSGRGYYPADLNILTNLASASGLISVLVFSLYLNSPEVTNLYAQPHLLWGICPLFAYWITRVLIMGSRGEIDEDPIAFALKDSRSWFTALCIAFIVLSASQTWVVL